MDFERLTRLQRLMRETRTTLKHTYPHLPPGTTLVQHNLPLSAVYALGGSFALQTWYRDTTVHWASFSDFSAGDIPHPMAVVEFEDQPPHITLVDPRAMSLLVESATLIEARRYDETLARLDSLERMRVDPNARSLRASMAGIRATALAATGRISDAEAHARRALALDRRNPDARFVLGLLAFRAGHLEEAEAHFDTLLLVRPEGDSLAAALRERVREARRGR
jgi:tetratricopeptide (TPR) repeat protein